MRAINSKILYPDELENTCNRCGDRYYPCDGCECNNLSDDEVAEIKKHNEQMAIDAFEYEKDHISDYYSDEIQNEWEAHITRY